LFTGGFCGLQNLGATCYLNTLLQSLASCPMFVEWLDQQSKSSTVSYTLNKTLKCKIFGKCIWISLGL